MYPLLLVVCPLVTYKPTLYVRTYVYCIAGLSLAVPSVIDPSELTESVAKLSIAELSDTVDSMTKVNRS